VQGSLFIANDYLGFKRRKKKHGFSPRFSLKNKLQAISAHNHAQEAHTGAYEAVATLPHELMAYAQEAHEAIHVCKILCFQPVFLSFFLLETHRNLK